MPLKISNSDTRTFICERKFYYAYGMGITTKSQPTAISKGLFGHTLLENWYTHKSISQLQDKYTELSIQADEYSNPEFALKDMAKVYYLILSYIDYYYQGNADNIPKIHYIEQEFELDLKPYIGQDMTFVFKPDLIYEENGKLVVVDHKFTYEFYKPQTIALDTQLTKYIVALTLLDKDIQYGILNQLRTREVNTNRFQRELVTPTYNQFETVWEDHIKTAKRIEQWFHKSPTEQQHSERIYNPLVCKFCSYSDLCVAELRGNTEEAETIIKDTMEPYAYGQKNLDYIKELKNDGNRIPTTDNRVGSTT